MTCVHLERNSRSNACGVLLRLVPGADVVKGLNTLSAWALQNGLLAGKQVKQLTHFSDSDSSVAGQEITNQNVFVSTSEPEQPQLPSLFPGLQLG